MIGWLTLFFIFLIILFFISRSLTRNLYLLFFLLTQNKEQSVQFLTWLFLPGTVIHELSHLLVAELLRVPTGQLSFTPEIRENNQVRMGGVKIAKTGPLRYFLIGLAPTLVGITTITLIMHFSFLPLLQKVLTLPFRPANYQLLITNYCLLFALCYLIFALSNTMFSSKKDLKTILFPILLIVVLGAFFWLGDFKISLPLEMINSFTLLLKTLNYALLGTMIIDLLFLTFIRLLLHRKITHNLVSKICYH